MDRRDVLKTGLGLSALSLLQGCGGGDIASTNGAAPAPTPPPILPPSTDPIVRVEIHPSIGIARVGNSPEYFIGQEVSGPLEEPSGGFKDAAGALKKQAARFRLYGYDARGAVVREITSAEAKIAWTVHVANKKAAWYAFETALDVPIAQPAPRRNAGIAREALTIDSGARSISGTGNHGVFFDTGTFMGHPVPLGELRTDEAGRLIFLGGHGRSFSPQNLPLTTFANNEGWCDDTSDGPVTARVELDGVVYEPDPAWVITAPPNYGPSISAGYITMYDTIFDIQRRSGTIPDRATSFGDDIYPLFSRLVDMQWLNAGVLRDNGPGTSGDFTSPAYTALLADASPANAPFREQVFQMFRNPSYYAMQPVAIPPLYGDEIDVPAMFPQNWYAVTETQYVDLIRWAQGQFYPSVPAPDVARSLESIPLSLQPSTLDRATLDACLGGPFHPGCEATWPMRRASMFSAPLRLRARLEPEPDYGDVLTPATALADGGPLSASGPGSVTRWMAVPWQTDTSSCLSAYEPEIDPYLPTFWPARVPNHILTEDDYATLMNSALPLQQRLAAFYNRPFWLRHIVNDDKIASITRMVSQWYMLGLVADRPGPSDIPSLPAQMKVESESTFTTPPLGKRSVHWRWGP